jgi:hypothetical protein
MTNDNNEIKQERTFLTLILIFAYWYDTRIRHGMMLVHCCYAKSDGMKMSTIVLFAVA